jgi:heme A synthase
MKLSRFAVFAWCVLVYNLAVILWGAFVRATGSGAGCGNHWPLCNGVIVPLAPQAATLIEFGHRLTSGLSLVLVVVLVVWGFRSYAKGSPVRTGVLASLFFVLAEALIGAGLVLFHLVTDNASIARAISMALHLINTFLLLAALALTAWWASGGARIRLRGQGIAIWGWGLAMTGALVLGMSGAITALGDTLFPAQSLAEGFRQDFLPAAHFLLRLRVWHPLIAVSVGLYLVLFALTMSSLRPGLPARRLAWTLTALVLVQIGAGFLDVVLLAPLWLQIIHLALAASVWITLVLLGAVAFSAQEAPAQVLSPQATPA